MIIIHRTFSPTLYCEGLLCHISKTTIFPLHAYVGDINLPLGRELTFAAELLSSLMGFILVIPIVQFCTGFHVWYQICRIKWFYGILPDYWFLYSLSLASENDDRFQPLGQSIVLFLFTASCFPAYDMILVDLRLLFSALSNINTRNSGIKRWLFLSLDQVIQTSQS